MKKVKDNSIGMGLACSHTIMRELKGNLFLKESQRGRTIFQMNLPVEYQQYLENISMNNNGLTCQSKKVLFNFKRRIQKKIELYLIENSNIDERYIVRYSNLTVENGENVNVDSDRSPTLAFACSPQVINSNHPSPFNLATRILNFG